MISVVTPTYNRKNKVVLSIESSLKLINEGFFQELIVVDDASSDNTYEFLRKNYSAEISLGVMKVFRLDVNVGVTGAKNFGALKASGDYLVYMDSDDTFTDNAGGDINSIIEANPNYSIYFFRCIDSVTNHLVGIQVEPTNFGLEFLINGKVPGECLPVLSRKAISKFVYPTSLRGCESLAYYKILYNQKDSGYLSDLVCRVYDTVGDDRLCTSAEIQKRSSKMIFFNLSMLKYWRFLKIRSLLRVFFRLVYYSLQLVNSKLMKVY